MTDGPDPERTAEMAAEVAAAPGLYRPSRFWDELAATNAGMLRAQGFVRFKRTVAQNYFNWLVTSPWDVQFRAALRAWAGRPTADLFRVRSRPFDLWTILDPARPVPLRWYHRAVYTLFVGLLWECARADDRTGLADRLEEPVLGDPIPVFSRGRRISQDLANSVRECSFVARHAPGGLRGVRSVAELGAGYGRLGTVWATLGVKYLVFDIPPALGLAEWYLTALFPEKKAFRFRRFGRFADVEDEVRGCDLGFFTPNQLALFPPGFVDVAVTISTLPEMTREQVDNYLGLLGRVAAAGVYLKQWADHTNGPDGYRMRQADYRPPPGWAVAADEPDPVMPLFFNQFWVRPGLAGRG